MRTKKLLLAALGSDPARRATPPDRLSIQPDDKTFLIIGWHLLSLTASSLDTLFLLYLVNGSSGITGGTF